MQGIHDGDVPFHLGCLLCSRVTKTLHILWSTNLIQIMCPSPTVGRSLGPSGPQNGQEGGGLLWGGTRPPLQMAALSDLCITQTHRGLCAESAQRGIRTPNLAHAE